MRSFRKGFTLFLLSFVCVTVALSQDPSADTPAPNLAIQAVGTRGTAQPDPNKHEDEPSASESVAVAARKQFGQGMAKVRVSPDEAKEILTSVRPILTFASQDSGLPIHTHVESRMISREDLRTNLDAMKADDEELKRLEEQELSLKKFGYVPRTFSTRKFVDSMLAELIAGFYDPKTKTISLLNWVDPRGQRGVLAHELTHALQDQNFNLLRWEQDGTTATHATGRFQVNQEDSLPESDARHAVVEGQATMVGIDYAFMEQGRDDRLIYLPGAANLLAEFQSMIPVMDTPTIHAAPIVIRDGLGFPYREGLVFELEMLRVGGRELAYRRVFARPPLNTHEIMHPDVYLRRQKIRAPQIPDLNAMLADNYEVIDSGGLGELDVRSLVRQFENSRLADDISHGWRGTSYLLVKRKQVPTEIATTADVALIFVSSWSTPLIAQHFAKFYAGTVARRYAQVSPASAACQDHGCPVNSYQFNTEEGFVNIECRPNNLVLVSESVEPDTALAVNSEILKANSNVHEATNAPRELSSRYLDSPIFADLRELWEQRMLMEAARAFGK